jgi:hypothetical protein
MRRLFCLTSAACASFLLCSPKPVHAGTNLTTTIVEAAGTDWTAAIWKTNGTGASVAPIAGITYETVFNGTSIGNGLNNTRIRNPAAAGLQTFPGNSLMLDTNTELRAKGVGAILNFPGVGGNPGFILNGGMLNGGEDTTFAVMGRVQVAAQSYISHGANGGGGGISPLRAFNFTGVLSGTGNVVILNAGTTVAQQVSGSSNTFSGRWIVQCGWLFGAVTNSLGTNSITVDPLYTGYLAAMPDATSPNGPAWLELGYDLNSAGRLILTNGGVMVLHQNCIFSSVIIQDAALSAGTHYYAELAASFPNSFAAGGSGSLTVQPYGAPPAFPPAIITQPSSATMLAGSFAQLSATASGPPTWYQWQKGTNGVYVNATEVGDVTGSRSNVLTFSALAYSDGADYRLIVTNSAGAATSQVATVTVLAPLAVAAVNPAAGSTVSNLTQIQITFSTEVIWVDAADFLVNGQPASTVSPAVGGGSNYTFTFTQPAPGTIAIGWDAGQSITDLAGIPFNRTAPGSTWSYTLIDTVPPTVGTLVPAIGATMPHLAQVEVTFTKPVIGVQPSALLVNGQATTNVIGSSSGPYTFQFPQPPNGLVWFAWAAGNGITDTATPPNPFGGGSWTNTLNPAAGLPTVRINEFLASNVSTNGLVDQFGNLSPWIELYNFGSNDVNLAGYSLTDDPTAPDNWVFPSVLLLAGQFLVVFADGLDLKAVGGSNQLHTSFALTAAGAYLGLFDDESPRVALTEFAPTYPPQRNDYSYGYDSTNQLKYFSVPTPGAPNGNSSIMGVVADVHFTVERGFFDQPFPLLLTTETAGATIRYTTDGSQPTEMTTGTTYTNPLTIDHLTTVRAAAFATNSLPSLVQTHTYIFLTDVLNQPTNPPGFPITTGWSLNGWPSEYGMNQAVVTNPLYASEIAGDLLAIPTLSLSVKTDEMFGPNGIYTNSPAGTTRPDIECSAELIYPDGTPGFQTDCGLKIHGGGSAQKPMKKPLALKFKSSFGPGSLDYQFFPDSPVTTFSGGFVLRADYNNHWTHALTPYGSASLSQRSCGGLVRDAFYKDLQLAMGDLGSHSRYVHLYINGLYWGLYNPCEDLDRHFAAAYRGGSPDDYDSIKGSDSRLAVDGDANAYNTLLSFNNAGLASLSQYNQIQQYLDVKQYADYMLLQFYGANQDWGPQQNWIAVHNKKVPGALWEFLCWDDERTLEGVNDTPVGSPLNSVSPGNLQANLALNPEYRLLFADRTCKFLFNNGVLTTNGIVPIWQARAAQICQAIVGESARWGNSVPGGKLPMTPLPYPSYDTNTPYYSRNENWLGEQGRLLTNYFPFRTAVVLNQLRAVGLYPSVDAPVFNQFGGNVPFGFKLTMTAAAGTIYFTTNGVDPRVYGIGAISPQALVYSNALVLTISTEVMARACVGTNWSALADGSFAVAALGVPLRITELMYNPPGGDAYEFLEIENIGALPLDISGFSFQGITFIFPSGTLIQPGAVLVLANNGSPSAWAARYPGVVVFGYYGGNLSNGGERIALLDQNGNTVIAVNYQNSGGWPTAANGGGYSLEIINPNGDPDDPANWRPSLALNGSPGILNAPQPLSVVRLNEVMAENVGVVTNGTTTNSDWLELYNSGTNTVSLANWSLSNSGDTRKYVIPGGTNIAAGGYLVIWCDSATNEPGLHSGFNLGRKGENLFLYDATTNRVDAFSFGLQLTNYTLGRVGPAASWQLTVPTPGAANVAAVTGGATNLIINEWLANSVAGGSDWLELFNKSSSQPVALAGLYLATSNQLFEIRSLSFIPPLGFVQLFADENAGFDHLDFKLSAAGDAIVLYDYSGAQMDRVSFVNQLEGISQGRLPDASTNIVSFPGTASPGASNYVSAYAGPRLNELMAKNISAVYDPAGNHPDWLELVNPNPTNFSLAGMSLSTDPGKPGQWTIPSGVSIASNGYFLIWCDASLPASTNGTTNLNTGFSLSADGAAVYLFGTNAQVLDSVAFGAQIADISIGRNGGVWNLLSSPTPGAANAANAVLGNPASLRVNEWLANSGSSNDWFELYNTDPLPVSLSGLYLTDDPSIAGRTNSQIAPLSYIAGHGWVAYHADSHPSQGPNHVRFNLNKDGKMIQIYGSDLTLIDSVEFGLQTAGVSQGRFPDGAADLYSMPTPTPGAANAIPNNPPALNVISNRFAHLGQTLQLIAVASDPDIWYQTLTFSLTNSPAGAAIDPLTGALSWAISNVPAPSTNAVTVRVTDNGVPPISDAKTFLVMVQPPLQFSSVWPDTSGHINFTFNSLSGESYQLQYKNDLSDPQWLPLGAPVLGTGGPLTLTDSVTAQPHRFYRLLVTAQ